MAVEAASFRRVMEAIRLMSRLYMASREDSKPSRIKRGWLGSSLNSSRIPRTLDLPRISMFGIRLGSEPKRLSSITLNAGSRALSAAIGFCTLTDFSSSPEKEEEEPVNVSLRFVTIPVTTTSLICEASSCILITMFASFFPLQA